MTTKKYDSKGDEMIEEAIKLRSHANHDEVALKQLEETVIILAEHFKSDVCQLSLLSISTFLYKIPCAF